MGKVISLETIRKQRDIRIGLDDECIKIFRMIADVVLRVEDKKHKQKIINNIYSVTDFFERRI